MTGPQTRERVVEDLRVALCNALVYCDPPVEVQPGIFAGENLAELLAVALQQVADELGTIGALVRHRPGCWEADHIRALVYMADDPDQV